MDDVQWKAGTQVSFFYWWLRTPQTIHLYVWHVEDTHFLLCEFCFMKKIKEAIRHHVCGSTAAVRAKKQTKKNNLNLVSCGVRLPSSASNFFPELLPWVYLRKAFKGCEFVLSIDVLFRQGNVFLHAIPSERMYRLIHPVRGWPSDTSRINCSWESDIPPPLPFRFLCS